MRMCNQRAKFMGAASLLLAAASFAASFADSSVASEGAGAELQEIVVSARKRDENIENVPVAMSAITGDELDKMHAQSIEDLLSVVPGLAIEQNGAAGTNFPSIRGITSISGASTVGIYLNDTPVAIGSIPNGLVGQPDFKLFDLSRVEVLKGPQGTLYGASSLGGTIKYVTAMPVLDTTTQAYGADVSSTDKGGIDHLENAVVNLPLIDGRAAALVGIQYSSDSGYVDHLANAAVPGFDVGTTVPLHHTNWEEDLAVHAAVSAYLNDRLVVTPSIVYQHFTIGDTSYFDEGAALYATTRRITDPRIDEIVLPALSVKYSLPWATLVSSTSYFDRDVRDTADLTGLDSAYQGYLAQQSFGSGGAFIGNLLSSGQDRIKFPTYTEEVRLASSGDGRFSWSVGAFYNHAQSDLVHFETSYGTNAATQLLYGLTPLQVFGVPFPNDVVFRYDDDTTTVERALFGQLGYSPIEGLTASVGLRYFVETISNKTAQSGFYAPPTNIPGATYVTNQDARDTGETPKFTLSYQLDSKTLLYADASKGFRIGGPETPVPVNLCAADLAEKGLTSSPSSYGPDTTWNYELGLKGQYLERRLLVDASGFYIRWSQIQQTVILPDCGYGYEANVGTAVSKGVDASLKVRPLESLTIDATYGYTDARFTTANATLGVAVGDHTLYTPETTVSVTADYVFGVIDGAQITGRVSGSHQTSQRADLNYDGTIPFLPAFSLFSAQLGIERQNWRVAVFGKNLSNTHSNLSPWNDSYVNVQYSTFRPRTLGLEFKLKF